MMYALLRELCRTPTTPATVERFLFRAAKLMVIKEITSDDWTYLANLIAYRIRRVQEKGGSQRGVEELVLDRTRKQKEVTDEA